MPSAIAPGPRPARILPFPIRPLTRLTLMTAGSAPVFGRIHEHRFVPAPLGELARQYWLNLPFDYPTVGFDMFAVLPDRFEALVRPPIDASAGMLRGMVAHYKAMVRRAAGAGPGPWALGYQAQTVTTVAGFLAARHELVEAALLVAGRSGYCPPAPRVREK